MPDLLSDRRLRSLLDEADRVLSQLRQASHEPGTDSAMRTLDALHRDMGQRLHDLWLLELRQRAPDAELDMEQLVEIEELDEVEPLDDRSRLGDYAPEAPGAWVDGLQDLLALLGKPTDDRDAVTLAVEASRIQWATVGLRRQWPRYPEPIQVALLGMVAARCRFLVQHMEVDLGPRYALDRLRTYRAHTGLATVVGLVDEREPEAGTWTDDALHWWDMLVAGIRS